MKKNFGLNKLFDIERNFNANFWFSSIWNSIVTVGLKKKSEYFSLGFKIEKK